jgi:hypothetical protein
MSDRLSFLDGRVPPAFELRRVLIPAGGERIYDEAEWRGALVVVDRGEIELETLRGSRWAVRRGAILWLAGLPVWALCNPGFEAAVLVAVSRRTDADSSDEFSAPSPFQRSEGS